METLFAVLLAAGVGFLFLRRKAKEENPAFLLPPSVNPSPPVVSVPESVERVLLAPKKAGAGELETPVSLFPIGDKMIATDSCLASSKAKISCVDPKVNPHPNPDAGVSIGSDVTNVALHEGVASNVAHQWCVNIISGDTAGQIAEETVGDRRRYVELLAANPDKAQILSPELNFAELCVNERLYLPRSWNTHIDQKGRPAGKSGPYPPYDKLPVYPMPPMNVVSMGSVPWPPEAPTGWKSIESIIRGV